MSKLSYNSEVYQEYVDWLNENEKILTSIFVWTSLIDENLIPRLKDMKKRKHEFKLLKTVGTVRDRTDLSPKQKSKIFKWYKNVFRGDYLIIRAIRDLQKNNTLIEIRNLEQKNIVPNLKESIIEARKLHFLGFFDSSVIMCGKITEYLLKEKLKMDSINFDNKWGISKLYSIFRSKSKQISLKGKVIENVKEIIRYLRNICAHGNPEHASENDSNLVWQSLIFLYNELGIFPEKI